MSWTSLHIGISGVNTARRAMEVISENIANVHTEDWGPFGRGWELKSFQLETVAPYYDAMIAYPKVWSSAIKGTKTAEVIYLDAGSEAEQ